MTRTEKDSLGAKEIPDGAYYGIQTARAVENFPVSGTRERPELVRAYVQVKKAAALANLDLGVLDRERGEAILKAADEVLDGKFSDQFVVDVFQAGAGTSFNMNVNEVLANRALEMLGHQKGDYERLGPNDQVNMSQSTNDTFPTASHIAVLLASRLLLDNLRTLAATLRRNGEEFSRLPKPGRTHLMDALPVTLGSEFDAYATQFDLEPGDVLSWPQNSPHRVHVVEGLSVSISSFHQTERSAPRIYLRRQPGAAPSLRPLCQDEQVIDARAGARSVRQGAGVGR